MKALSVPFNRFGSLDFPVLRFSAGAQALKQTLGDLGDLHNGGLKRLLILFGGLGRATHFPHILQGRRADLFLTGGWIEIEQNSDVAAHIAAILTHAKESSCAADFLGRLIQLQATLQFALDVIACASMEIDPQELSPKDNYRLLIHSVIPRPIAWVGSVAPDGVNNLAPFSYFGAVTATPPTLMVSVGKRKGKLKDTAANLLAHGEAVVHIPDRKLVEAMVKTSAEVEQHVDEFELSGLTPVAATRVQAPRVKEAAIALECKVTQHLEIGTRQNDVFFLEVVYVHLREDILTDGVPDPEKLKAVGRLGGDGYSDTSSIFCLKRP